MLPSQNWKSGYPEVSMISDLVTANRLELVIIVMFLYEYIITFPRELSLFWLRKKTGSSWLFFIVRYLALLNYTLLGATSHFRMSDESCVALQKCVVHVQNIQLIPWAAFTALRVLALSDRSWLLASIVFLLSSANLVVTAWEVSLAGISGEYNPLVGCAGGANLTPNQDLIIVAVSRPCGIIADIVAIAVTWRYALRHGAANLAFKFTSQRGILSSLGKVILLNGTTYFIAILSINVAQIFPLLAVLGRASTVVEFFVLINPFTAILICRFMLALQAADQRAIRGQAFGETLDDTDTSSVDGDIGEMGFVAALVDSMGGTIPSDLSSDLSPDSDDPQTIEV